MNSTPTKDSSNGHPSDKHIGSSKSSFQDVVTQEATTSVGIEARPQTDEKLLEISEEHTVAPGRLHRHNGADSPTNQNNNDPYPSLSNGETHEHTPACDHAQDPAFAEGRLQEQAPHNGTITDRSGAHHDIQETFGSKSNGDVHAQPLQDQGRDEPRTPGSEYAELHGEDVPIKGNLWSLLVEGAEKNLDGIAIAVLHQPPEHLAILKPEAERRETERDHASWTYRELIHGAEVLARHLQVKGVGKGSRVVIILWNSLEWVLFYWAVARLDAVFIPLDRRLSQRPEELSHILKIVQPDAVIVWDLDEADDFFTAAPMLINPVHPKIICDLADEAPERMKSWQSLNNILKESIANTSLATERGSGTPEDWAVLLTTSGTTSLPKVCPHTARSIGTYNYLSSLRSDGDKQRYLTCGPGFHIMAIGQVMTTWRYGATLFFASKRFDAGATLKCVRDQKITYTHFTPTMLVAMQEHPSFKRYQLRHRLTTIYLGADVVGPALISRCKADFNADLVLNAWGMTEGLGVLGLDPTREVEDTKYSADGYGCVGTIKPGARVRICEPGSRTVLKRGQDQQGEIHIGGSTVIQQYLKPAGDSLGDDAMYTDDYGVWLKTGDLAYMDENGMVYLVGRQKDVIIRGGENIAPAIIERCLDEVENVKSQVVGMPDPVTGQAPVAVIQVDSSSPDVNADSLKPVLRERVLQQLGTMFSLSDIFTTDDLGISNFPTNTVGKVKKNDLRNLITDFLAYQAQEETEASHKSVDASVKVVVISAWSNVLGLSGEALGLEKSPIGFADSLSIMRFCYRVGERLGIKIAPTELMDLDTIEKQIKFLQQRKESSGSVTQEPPSYLKLVKRNGPPTADDIIMVNGDQKLFEEFTQSVEPFLHAFHLVWDDVECVYPKHNEASLKGARKNRLASNNLRWNYEIDDSFAEIGASELRQALEAALTRHDCLRSIYADSNLGPANIIIRPDPRFFNVCIREMSVETEDDFLELVHGTRIPFGGPPHPAYQAMIVRVEGTGRTGLIQSVHHGVFDAFSMSIFLADVDKLLKGFKREDLSQNLIPHKLFVDAFYSHRQSPVAKRSAQYHVERLRGIGSHEAAFWPKSKAPLLFLGSDEGWTYNDGTPGDHERQSFDRIDSRRKGTALVRLIDFSFDQLRAQHSIEPIAIAKAAISLFNFEVTGQDVAIFHGTDAARKWPFMEQWMADLLPNPLAITGPTLEISIKIVKKGSDSESVLELLRRMHDSQMEESRYAHVDYEDVMEQLGEEGKLVPDLLHRQLLNWQPQATSTEDKPVLKQKSIGNFMDAGFHWTFRMVSTTKLYSSVCYDDGHLRCVEADAAHGRVLDIMHWLNNPENWSRKVSERPMPDVPGNGMDSSAEKE